MEYLYWCSSVTARLVLGYNGYGNNTTATWSRSTASWRPGDDPQSVRTEQVQRVFMEEDMVQAVEPANVAAAWKSSAAGVTKMLFKFMVTVLIITVISGAGMYSTGMKEAKCNLTVGDTSRRASDGSSWAKAGVTGDAEASRIAATTASTSKQTGYVWDVEKTELNVPQKGKGPAAEG